MDKKRIENAAKEILIAIGENPQREGLIDTPKRVANAYEEMLSKDVILPTSFENDGYDELIILADIEFTSLCEHHILPFVGKCHIGYIPDKRIIGLSKLARVVDHFASRLQIQERMTQQIAQWLNNELQPLGVGVIIKAHHLCMSGRGVKQRQHETITSAMLGVLRDDINTRNEFLDLCR